MYIFLITYYVYYLFFHVNSKINNEYLYLDSQIEYEKGSDNCAGNVSDIVPLGALRPVCPYLGMYYVPPLNYGVRAYFMTVWPS